MHSITWATNTMLSSRKNYRANFTKISDRRTDRPYWSNKIIRQLEGIVDGKVKYELRIQIHEVRVQIHELKVQI